jgi:hypothetical protein
MLLPSVSLSNYEGVGFRFMKASAILFKGAQRGRTCEATW